MDDKNRHWISKLLSLPFVVEIIIMCGAALIYLVIVVTVLPRLLPEI